MQLGLDASQAYVHLEVRLADLGQRRRWRFHLSGRDILAGKVVDRRESADVLFLKPADALDEGANLVTDEAHVRLILDQPACRCSVGFDRFKARVKPGLDRLEARAYLRYCGKDPVSFGFVHPPFIP